jgi:hypothetical protein
MQLNLDSNLHSLIENQTMIPLKPSHTILSIAGKNSLWHRKVGVEVNQNNKLPSYLLLLWLKMRLKNLKSMIINHQ